MVSGRWARPPSTRSCVGSATRGKEPLVLSGPTSAPSQGRAHAEHAVTAPKAWTATCSVPHCLVRALSSSPDCEHCCCPYLLLISAPRNLNLTGRVIWSQSVLLNKKEKQPLEESLPVRLPPCPLPPASREGRAALRHAGSGPGGRGQGSENQRGRLSPSHSARPVPTHCAAKSQKSQSGWFGQNSPLAPLMEETRVNSTNRNQALVCHKAYVLSTLLTIWTPRLGLGWGTGVCLLGPAMPDT